MPLYRHPASGDEIEADGYKGQRLRRRGYELVADAPPAAEREPERTSEREREPERTSEPDEDLPVQKPQQPPPAAQEPNPTTPRRRGRK